MTILFQLQNRTVINQMRHQLMLTPWLVDFMTFVDRQDITITSARAAMVIVVANRHCDSSSNLDETDCISHCTNTLGKGINPIILPPAMGK